MLPAWAVNLTTQFGLALVKWGLAEIALDLARQRKLAETERLNGVRNGENAKRYEEATTRADQIRAAIDLVNRNNV